MVLHMETNENTETPRYYVHTITSGIGNKIREPHWVIDRNTNKAVDEYASKRAAKMHADQLNDEAARGA